MNRSRNERLAELFHEAYGLAEGERARFVERECAGDPELRAELETLLAQDRRAGELDASARLAAPVDAAMERLEDEPGDLDDVHSDEILEGPTVHGRAPRAGAGRAPRELPGYTIVGELGSGGAGTVFEARQERMNRPVALKILSGRMAFSRKAGRRFQREAWIAGRLNHPNIVKVYESGSFEDVSYYSMELIRGGSLHDVIENMRRHGRDERLGLEFGTRLWYDWAINQIIAAARALDYTHREGVVHRDVKPMNLLLDHETATVKLADFGLAIEDDATRLTSEGRALGTLRYMSAEQLLGKRDEIDGRTDTYALAVTLFELLTLEYPYVGETYERYVAAVMNEDARRLTAINNRVSRDLEVVIGKALEKDRRDRYESAGEFADDLENVLHFRPIRARPPSPAGRARRWIKRRPVHAILLVTLAIALPLGGWMVRRNVEQRRMLREATVKDLIKDLTGAGRDPDKLIELGNRIVELDPHYEQGLYGLRARAVGYFLRARYAAETDQAATARESALADARRLIAAAPDMGWPRMLYAKFLKSFGRLEEAQIEREKGQNLDGDDEESLFFEALGLTDQENPSREDRERAQSLLTKILAQSERADAIELRARVRANLGDREGAIQDYRQLAQLEPDRHSSPRELGLLLTLEKRFDEGRQRLQRASELAPEDWSVWESLAVNAIEWGRERQGNGDSQVAMMLFREGEAHARRAVELAPEQPMPHINLGNALVDQFRLDRDDRSRIDESIRQFTTARELVSPARPEHQEAANVALLNVCDLMVEAGEAQSALETCLEATRALPLHPNGFYNLAGAYVLLGRNDDAFDALEKDFELGDYEHEWLSQDDWFEPIRDDPRFENLLARMRAKAGDE